MTAVRIGAVPFLNARPLVHGLRTNPDYTLSFDAPAPLGEKLRLGEVDVGLVPVVEYLRGVGDWLLPGICIASDGPVRTVKLYSRVPLPKLTAVAVDSGSRTSVALLRILLAECYEVTPDFHTHRPDLAAMLSAHEAALLIGDAAFTDSGAPYVWDLGQGWKDLVNQPFVYATWILREGVNAGRVAGWLSRAMREGQAHLDDIARAAAGTANQDETTLLHYLRHSLHYELGERELRGLETFQKLCLRYNIVHSARELRFAPRAPSLAAESPAVVKPTA